MSEGIIDTEGREGARDRRLYRSIAYSSLPLPRRSTSARCCRLPGLAGTVISGFARH